MPRSTSSLRSPARCRAQQFDLHHVQRVEVGVAVADAASERRVGGEGVGRPGDPLVPRRGSVQLGGDAIHDPRAQLPVRHERVGVAHADLEIGLGEHHAHVVDDAAEERPAVEHGREQLGVSATLLRDGVERAAAAVPTREHQAALRPSEHPRDGPQVLDAVRAGARGGREPMFNVEISRIGVISPKKRANAGSSYTSAR